MNMHNHNRKRPLSHKKNPLKAKLDESLSSYTSLSQKYVQLTESYGRTYTLE